MNKDTEIDMKEVELNELDPEKQPMTGDGQAGSGEKNGSVKLKVPEDEVTFTGLSKEELMKVAGTPGWELSSCLKPNFYPFKVSYCICLVTSYFFVIFCLQVGENTLGASYPVLAWLGWHVGWSHRDHRPGPSLQAHPWDELVERRPSVPDPWRWCFRRWIER